MAYYVDGFVIPMPKKKVAAYKRIASVAAKVWRDHGALDYRECVGEDLQPKGVQATFPKLARAKAGETIVFAWILYRSRAHRDRVNAKVMKDPRITGMDQEMPFEMKRMAYGGFEVIVQA
jgi:uncharacterized protein YbaA (DUF1428 family)